MNQHENRSRKPLQPLESHTVTMYGQEWYLYNAASLQKTWLIPLLLLPVEDHVSAWPYKRQVAHTLSYIWNCKDKAGLISC